MTKEIATIDYKDKELIQALKNTIAKNASDTDMTLFLEHCKGTGLNPWKKEVWFIKGKGYTKANGDEVDGTLQIMTGINGFYAIANSNPHYDGIEVIESEEKIKINSATVEGWKGEVKTFKIDPAIEVPKFVEARVWRKDRRFPSTAIAKWSEYGKDVMTAKGKRSIWGQMPSIMLAKCAESLALRKAFPQELNGLYSQEEMPAEFGQVVEVEKEQPRQLSNIQGLKSADALQQEATAKTFGDDVISFNKSDMAASQTVKKIYHYDLKSYLADMPPAKANAVFRKLEAKQGFELSDGLWCIPDYIEGLKEFITADQAGEAA